MVIILIICVSMALLSGLFWVIEARPAWKRLRSIHSRNPLLVIGNWFIALYEAKFLMVDISATVILTVVFGFGGLVGNTMGLTISNVISIALLWSMFHPPTSMEACHA